MCRLIVAFALLLAMAQGVLAAAAAPPYRAVTLDFSWMAPPSVAPTDAQGEVRQTDGFLRLLSRAGANPPTFTWALRYPIPAESYPVLVMSYRAEGISALDRPVLQMEYGAAQAQGLAAVMPAELRSDGGIYEFRKELTSLAPNAALQRVHFTLPRSAARLDVLELSFESVAESVPAPVAQNVTFAVTDDQGRPVAEALVRAGPLERSNWVASGKTDANGQVTLAVNTPISAVAGPLALQGQPTEAVVTRPDYTMQYLSSIQLPQTQAVAMSMARTGVAQAPAEAKSEPAKASEVAEGGGPVIYYADDDDDRYYDYLDETPWWYGYGYGYYPRRYYGFGYPYYYPFYPFYSSFFAFTFDGKHHDHHGHRSDFHDGRFHDGRDGRFHDGRFHDGRGGRFHDGRTGGGGFRFDHGRRGQGPRAMTFDSPVRSQASRDAFITAPRHGVLTAPTKGVITAPSQGVITAPRHGVQTVTGNAFTRTPPSANVPVAPPQGRNEGRVQGGRRGGGGFVSGGGGSTSVTPQPRRPAGVTAAPAPTGRPGAPTATATPRQPPRVESPAPARSSVSQRQPMRMSPSPELRSSPRASASPRVSPSPRMSSSGRTGSRMDGSTARMGRAQAAPSHGRSGGGSFGRASAPRSAPAMGGGREAMGGGGGGGHGRGPGGGKGGGRGAAMAGR